jgi:hypothetical protein
MVRSQLSLPELSHDASFGAGLVPMSGRGIEVLWNPEPARQTIWDLNVRHRLDHLLRSDSPRKLR